VAARYYVAILLFGVLAIIQTAVLPALPVAGVEPQLLFLVALAWGLLRGLDEGLILAFMAGIWVDLFSLTPLGLSALAFMAGVAGPLLLRQLLPPRRLLIAVLSAALGTLTYLLFYALALRVFGHAITPGGLIDLLPIVLMHAVLITPIYLLAQTVGRAFQPRRVEF